MGCRLEDPMEVAYAACGKEGQRHGACGKEGQRGGCYVCEKEWGSEGKWEDKLESVGRMVGPWLMPYACGKKSHGVL